MKRGTVVLVGLDPTLGQEQRGTRPCVVVSDDAVSQHQRFPVLMVVPLTSTALEGPLYPVLSPSKGSGLKAHSWALTDQLRCIDKRRVLRAYGRVAPAELGAIETSLRVLLGLSAP